MIYSEAESWDGFNVPELLVALLAPQQIDRLNSLFRGVFHYGCQQQSPGPQGSMFYRMGREVDIERATRPRCRISQRICNSQNISVQAKGIQPQHSLPQ